MDSFIFKNKNRTSTYQADMAQIKNRKRQAISGEKNAIQ